MERGLTGLSQKDLGTRMTRITLTLQISFRDWFSEIITHPLNQCHQCCCS